MQNKELCLKCNLKVCAPCVPEAANDNKFVRLPTDEVLRSPEMVNHMARRCAGLGISSRRLPTAIATSIFSFKGPILNHVGRSYVIGSNDIDNAFRHADRRVADNQDDDLNWTPDFRWIRHFYKRAEKPGTQTAQIRITERLRLIFIYLAILDQSST